MKGYKINFDITLTEGDKILPLSVEASVIFGSPGGAMTSWGFEPPEPDEVKVLGLRDTDTGKAVEWDDLTEAQQSTIDQKAIEVADSDRYGPDE